MPCHESIVVAKETFVSKVSDGIAALMKFGYSRERASNALIRELNRGDSITRPTDHEIFEVMKRYNLGIEEATKAIVVSKAMRRAMVACENPAQAVEVLASKISLSNLLYDSSEDEEVNDDTSCSSIRPELRVEPVKTTRKTRQAARQNGSNSQSSRSKKSQTGRKRPIEETVSRAESKETTRTRADSVAEEVEEKIYAKKSTDDDSNSDSSSSSPAPLRTPVVRGKRGMRVDDSESQAHKRLRGSGTI
eukprot:scaffold2299_cov131-Cylindrotheca_fusiformis.AAC.4